MSNNIVIKRNNDIFKISTVNYLLKYDSNSNIDSLNLVICKKMKYKNRIFKFKTTNKLISVERIKCYDFLGNDKFIPLINLKALNTLKLLNENDFEIFNTEIFDYNGKLISSEYKLLNILSNFQIADLTISKIEECFVQNNIKLGYYTKLKLNKNLNIDSSHIFRDKINNGINKYVSKYFYEIYKKEKLTGLSFSKVEMI